jgi:hypothetical protein
LQSSVWGYDDGAASLGTLREPIEEEHEMADGTAGRGAAGIGLGGILVIIGIIVAIVWSVWLGIIIALIGLVAFGGFARGRWY